ncbi:outer membrane beta-barrel protein [Psychrobium sp. MM17-31]|uniref:OmpW/AlkL family protein n=1 Tax=Psychrobium sp. MM17-31 TaxID=2917758 RepID=UPI001EF4F85A|nr:OmpW family outer membrane protein [Psychrobium sp. MM17-31]MCG7530500.1 outer membrane beta-barrel protein [Psychrobium sp. MM17-31]
MKKTLINIAMMAALATTSSVAMANKAGDMILRVGAVNVQPNSDKATVYAGGNKVDLGAGALTASVESDTQLGLNFVYFATDKVAVEVLAATPFTHDLKVHSGDATLDLGETTHLPPTVSALYYLNAPSDKFQPYVGLGINYTVFFEEEFAPGVTGADSVGGLNLTDLKLKNSWGLSAQVGFDYHLNEKWLVNASARYIDIDTTASFKAIDGSVPGKVEVSVDPMVYMVSVGYKF